MLSSQDSSGAWSGRIRSAWALVSSMKFAEADDVRNLGDGLTYA